MWRIYGVLFFGDKDYFLEKGKKAFSRERLVAFLEETGVALFDTAMEVIRQRGNASDQVSVILDIKGGLYGCTGCLRLHGLTRSL